MSNERKKYDHEFNARSRRRPWKRRYSVRISRTVRSSPCNDHCGRPPRLDSL